MLSMANAASAQALEEGKKRLREFLEASEGAGQVGQRRPMAMPALGEEIPMRKLNGRGKSVGVTDGGDDEDGDGEDI